ncbi:OmpA family protein [Tenacibaculum sp. UWU-22]|uniref:OmpA family protein n=1 Tax=Tenacibaculum sp. UWU-22 TaxID=3234187 RepID=UPI0034DB686F
MKTKLVILLFSLIAIEGFGQRKYAANKYFDNFAYVKAAELYLEIYNKGDDSKDILEHLGDSYYFNANTEEAEKWYKELIEKYSDQIDSQYIFKYAQVLKSNGKPDESDTWLHKFYELNPDKKPLETIKQNPNYFDEYTNKPNTFLNVRNISVNTRYSDFSSFVHNGDLYFASTRPIQSKKVNRIYKWNDQPFLNIYKGEEKILNPSLEKKELDLGPIEKIANIDTDYHEASVVITKDGSTMYFTRDNYNGKRLGEDNDRTVRLKIYRATLIDNQWKDIIELPFNSDLYSVGHPALSTDEKTLYFASDMPGGKGETDLYKVSINDDDTYGDPVNLGDEINTKQKEMFPFVGADNTLYFASNGHIGLGLLDIFQAKMNSDGTFSNIENLGAPINSSADDFALVVSEDKRQGFFSSNRPGGKGDDDIYSFLVYDCTQNITGVVTDSKTNKILPDATVKLIDEEGKVVSVKTSDVNGNYTFPGISCNTKFTVLAEKQDYRSDKKQVELSSKPGADVKADLSLTPLIIEDQIVIKPIYFDFDKYNIRQDAEYELEHIVTVMKNHPDMVIRIESHTDCRGTEAYNRTLSDNRAKSTRDYIISRGIESNRIQSAVGYGESQLLYNCEGDCKSCTEEQHQLNRRSYFYIVSGNSNVKVVGQ